MTADDIAYRFDGRGGSRSIDLSDAIEALAPGGAPPAGHGPHPFVWIHCNIDSPVLQALVAAGVIDRIALDLLSAPETRPRCVPHDEGILLNLRGRAVEEVEGESDLVAIRMWSSRRGVISAWRRPTIAVQGYLGEVERGFCAHTTGDFLARLALRIVDTIEPMVDELSETIDELELEAVDGSEVMHRRELSEVRRDAIDFRRFLYPQRDALSSFLIQHVGFVHEHDRSKLHDAHERVVRFIEELEVTRERCSVLHDEIIDNRAERMNRQILLLSIVSALFLPASLVAGLLGMNVGGIPGEGHPMAFAAICGLVVIAIAAELAVFRWLKII